MRALPTGTVTFLFSDIEDSSTLLEQHRQVMRQVLTRHDEIARTHVEAWHGHIVKPRGEGDSLFCVFARAADAVQAAFAWQLALQAEPWPDGIVLRVRLALHTGEDEPEADDYRGIVPSRCARLRSLAIGGQILLSETSSSLAQNDGLPPGATLRDWGQQKLRGLNVPIHVFQLLHPDLSNDAPPLLSRPHNLPRALSSLVGRQNDAQRVQERLTQARLVTLTGPSGVGKTRLALRVAEDALKEFSDGAWLVELAGLADPALVPQRVARALGIAETPVQAAADALGEFLQTRHVLLLLDNCEHLLDAVARLSDSLLRSCPHLRILATSREPLGLAGETQWPVPCLALPPARHALQPEQLLQCESVRLFVERVQTKAAGFRLTDANAGAVARLCRRLEGLPLDLELVAPWVRSLPLERIADELERSDRLRLLSRGERTAVPRQQSARAGIDFSYALLSEVERRLLRRLSVFSGGWTEDAAVCICADENLVGWDVMDGLSRLVDKSLVQSEEVGADGVMRYRLLETIRRYAEEKRRGEENETQLRTEHRECFLRLAEDAAPHLSGPEQVRWLDRLDADHDNLRAALKWSVEPEIRLRLAVALHRFWRTRGYVREGRVWLEGAIQTVEKISDSLYAKALNAAGILAWDGQDFAAARQFYARSLELHRTLGDQEKIAGLLNNLGMVADDEERKDEARRYYEESLTAYRELGDLGCVASALNNLAAFTMKGGEYADAKPLLEESLKLFETLGRTEDIAITHLNLAELFFFQNDQKTMRHHLRACLPPWRELKNALQMSLTLTLQAAASKPADAAVLLAAADALRSEDETPPTEDAVRRAAAERASRLAKAPSENARRRGLAMTLDEAADYALERLTLSNEEINHTETNKENS